MTLEKPNCHAQISPDVRKSRELKNPLYQEFKGSMSGSPEMSTQISTPSSRLKMLTKKRKAKKFKEDAVSQDYS